ncbi:MAG: carboxymuconolactone decarboxylase family protein [Acidimicrobiales bacterium]|nr:carboxymuconolactone decarboxylase family protein [Acidimicrobiales bacterium]
MDKKEISPADARLLELAMGDKKAQEPMAVLRRVPEATKAVLGVIGAANAEVWSGPHLSSRTHCLVNLATLASVNRPVELRIRVRGLLVGGIEVGEIADVFMHTAAYCGFPAGVEAIRTLAEVVEELQAEGLLPVADGKAVPSTSDSR